MTQLLTSVWYPDIDDAGRPLMVRDLASGSNRMVGPLEWAVGAIYFRGDLTWAADRTVFGTGPAGTGVLVRLEA